MVLLIYKNYLNDPKLTEEEREEVRSKAEQIFAKRKLTSSGVDQE